MAFPYTYQPDALTGGFRRGRGWSILAAGLLVFGLLLAPVTIVAAHAKTLLTDTDTFVATFAPLSATPVMQRVVIDAVTDSLEENIDVSDVTTQLLAGLDLSDWTRRALAALEDSALEQAQAKAASLVEQVVISDRFAAVWEQTLRSTHTQSIATLQNDPNAVVAIDATGTLELQLGPIIAEVKQRLLDDDRTFALAIPEIQLGLPLTQKHSLTNIHNVYSLVTSLGTWLPWVTAALVVAGIFAARRRVAAALATAIGLVLGTGVLGAVIFIGRHASTNSLEQDALPKPVILAIYDAAVGPLGHTTLVIGVLCPAVAVALILLRRVLRAN